MWWWATTSTWPIVVLAISIVIVAIVAIVMMAIVTVVIVTVVAIVIVAVVAIVIVAIVAIVIVAIVAIVLSPPSIIVIVLPFSLADSCPVPWCPARIAVGISCRAILSRVRWLSTSLAIPAISAPSIVIFVIVGPFFPLVRTIPFLFFVLTALFFVFLTVLAAIFLRSTNL